MKSETMAELLSSLDDDLIEVGGKLLTSRTKPHRSHKIPWAAGIAAALVLSMTVGAAAAGVFGRVFDRYTGKTGKDVPPGINDRVIENAVILPQTSVVSENEESANLSEQDDIKLDLTEYSCDGMTVSLGFSLRCTDETLNEKYTTFFPARFGPQDSETYEIWVNGEKIDGTMYYSNVPFFEATDISGMYTGIVTFLLPESQKNAEQLSVRFRISKLEAQSFPAEAKNDITMRTEDAVEYRSLDVNLEGTAIVYADAAVKRYTPQCGVRRRYLE